MRFIKAAARLLIAGPIKRTRVLRRCVVFLERESRPGDKPWMSLPGHSKYAHLPGHDAERDAAYYDAMRALFLHPPNATTAQQALRADILKRFEDIDYNVDIKSSPVEGLAIAEAVLSLRCDGGLVECGCYTGGSTAKLSILAAMTGRHLFGFDSFEGLPEPSSSDVLDYHIRRGAKADHYWAKGEYEGTLDTVRHTLSRYGCPDSCTLVKGWFSDTLAANLPTKVALAFADVDLPSSARDCIRAIWPRLQSHGVFFSHDAAYVKVLHEFHDAALWREELRENPPVFFGAGFGMGDAAANLGFMIKGDVSAEYVKSLMLNK